MNIEEFRNYARDFNVIPVWRKLLADSETPLGVYLKPATNSSGTLLLESAEYGEVWPRYSCLGVRSEE